MNSQSIRMNLSKDGRGKTKVKVNGSLRGQGLCMQMRKRMWHHKISLMHLNRDTGQNKNNNIEVLVLVGSSVGHAVRRTLRDIVHKIRVVGLRYTMHMRHRQLWMLVRVFHIYI